MKLEDQVVSLELAKKLKDLEVGQESLFWWSYAPKDKQDGEWVHVLTYSRKNNLDKTISAYTVAELGELINWSLNRGEWYIHIAPKFSDDGSWVLWFEDEDGAKKTMYPDGCWYIADRNEADARAAMLVYLIDNNLLDPKTWSV